MTIEAINALVGAQNLDRRIKMQLQPPEVHCVAQALAKPCNLLVFGVGSDSALWIYLNRGGRTAFIEDDANWFAAVKLRVPGIESYLVKYTTVRREWREIVNVHDRLRMELPEKITRTKWDVILVDGPAGDRDHKPGRMQSIYAASTLVAPGGHVFVHDVNRPVEDFYAERYLGPAIEKVAGFELIGHYRLGFTESANAIHRIHDRHRRRQIEA